MRLPGHGGSVDRRGLVSGGGREEEAAGHRWGGRLTITSAVPAGSSSMQGVTG